jgi:hypothetical protein
MHATVAIKFAFTLSSGVARAPEVRGTNLVSPNGVQGRSPWWGSEAFLHFQRKNPYHYIEGYEYISEMTISDFVTGIPCEVLCLLVPF